jgi:hypothetical protein
MTTLIQRVSLNTMKPLIKLANFNEYNTVNNYNNNNNNNNNNHNNNDTNDSNINNNIVVKLVKETERLKIFHGDSLNYMKNLEDKSIGKFIFLNSIEVGLHMLCWNDKTHIF